MAEVLAPWNDRQTAPLAAILLRPWLFAVPGTGNNMKALESHIPRFGFSAYSGVDIGGCGRPGS